MWSLHTLRKFNKETRFRLSFSFLLWTLWVTKRATYYPEQIILSQCLTTVSTRLLDSEWISHIRPSWTKCGAERSPCVVPFGDRVWRWWRHVFLPVLVRHNSPPLMGPRGRNVNLTVLLSVDWRILIENSALCSSGKDEIIEVIIISRNLN